MKYPKLVIASDGMSAAVLLDGVCIGQGIERLDFSSEDKGGKRESTIRIMDLNVGRVKMASSSEFDKILEAMSRKS